jgi:hypothetical protein
VGPGFLENAPDACQDDLPANIAAIRKFLRACIVKPISQDDFEEILAFNIVVKPNGALCYNANSISDRSSKELQCPSSLPMAGRTPCCCPRWLNTY